MTATINPSAGLLPQHQVRATPLSGEVPLCVDLDGTLILSDVLWESLILLFGKPLSFLRGAWALRKGKAAMKSTLAEDVQLDPSALPYREDLLAYLRDQHEQGRRLVLVTATHSSIAQKIADFLGMFEEVMATDEKVNLGGERKRQALVAAFGERGFDYIGDHDKDLAIFRSSRMALLADPSHHLEQAAGQVSQVDKIFRHQRRWLKVVLRGLRVHQWAKNALLVVPLITAHKVLDMQAWFSLALAFLSFSLLASATYIVNDLHDLAVDRKHHRKRTRPLASGDLPIPVGIGLGVLLAGASLWLASFLPRLFLVFLLIYTVLTLAYSFNLKRRLIVDALTLAILYTLRIIAGAVAINVVMSEWLLMFSLFFFVSLALLKRAIELDEVLDGKKIPGRGYFPTDIDIIRSIGPTSGLIAVLVLGLYISSPAVTKLYKTPQMLWLLAPVMIYWITRIWFLANRRQVNHDPIVFAIMDWRSYVVALVAGIILMLASFDLLVLIPL